MTCDMKNPEMWQTVCEHWKIPNYCYTKESTLNFASIISKKSISVMNDCAYLPVDKIRTISGEFHFINHLQLQ